MNVILYMAMTVNGLIAKTDDDTRWGSKPEWDSYSAAVRAAGNLIVGRRTYDILTRQPEFSELSDVQLVVVSRKDFVTRTNQHLVAHSPQAALEILAGHNQVMVTGGGKLNSSFLEEGLADEIYLDVEPIILGQGIPLFKGKDFLRPLEFLGHRKFGQDIIQLHYRVIK